jgi:predicted  nucleic acid-binding Zn-ribbon protein
VSLSDVDRTLASLSKSGNISALSKAIAVLETNTKGSKQELKDLAEVVKPYKEQVRDSAGATAQATIAQREQTKAVQESIDAFDSQEATFEGIQKTVADYEKKIRSLDDAYEAAQTGAKAFGDSIERSTELDNLAGAAVNVSERLRTITADLSALPKSFQDAFDPAKITEGSGKAIESLLAIGDAVTKQFQTLIVSGNEQLIPGLAAQYRDTITKALQAAGIPPDQIKQYLGLAGLNDEQIQVALKVTQVEEQLALVKQRLALFQTDLSEAPQEVRVEIDKALLAGDTARANALIDQATRPRTVSVYVATPLEQQYNTRGVTAERTAQRQGRRSALGGPLAKGQMSMVNEMGAEMFVPSSSGFVMDSDDSKALVRGVEAMLAGGGGSTINVYETASPRQTATEVVRKQRDAAYLIGR